MNSHLWTTPNLIFEHEIAKMDRLLWFFFEEERSDKPQRKNGTEACVLLSLFCSYSHVSLFAAYCFAYNTVIKRQFVNVCCRALFKDNRHLKTHFHNFDTLTCNESLRLHNLLIVGLLKQKNNHHEVKLFMYWCNCDKHGASLYLRT